MARKSSVTQYSMTGKSIVNSKMKIINKAGLTPMCLIFCICCFCFPLLVEGQDWKAIRPFSSRCKDVEAILNVSSCSLPVSNYEFPDFKINITFYGRSKGQNVRRDTVIGILVVLKKFIPLGDFEPNRVGYDVGPDSDIGGGKVFTNAEKGMEFSTQTFEGREYVTGVRLFRIKKGGSRL